MAILRIVIRIHPLGAINVCRIFMGIHPIAVLKHFQSGTQWWTDGPRGCHCHYYSQPVNMTNTITIILLAYTPAP